MGTSADAGGRETVLLVEDETLLRSLAATVLRREGYTVLEAADTAAALRLAESHPGPVHLLLADVGVPQSGGPPLAAAVARLRPGLRVLYCSGLGADQLAGAGRLPAGVPFLQKPFTLDDLTRKVREVLDGGQASPPQS